MSAIRALIKQSSHYLTGQVVIMVAGFASFPILTRIFSVSDYGILAILNTTLSIIIAIAKFGFPHFIVQFYTEFKSKGKIGILYSTMFLSSLGIAGAIAALFLIVAQLFKNRLLDKDIVTALSFVSMLILINCPTDIVTSFLRAEQRTKVYNLVGIMRRYGGLILGIYFSFYIVKGLNGFFLGQVISATMVLCLLMPFYLKRITIKHENFSTGIIKDSFKFGFPLVWAEMGHVVLNCVDRYLIEFYLGSASVGLYTAAYNLSTHATDLITYPLAYAMTPIYTGLLVEQGEGNTKQFLTRTFGLFLLIMLPVVFGFIAVGKDILALLASEKYLSANIIIPYVTIGQFIYACSLILNNGLLIKKKTFVLNNIMMVSCLGNIGLNIILIPRSGILGAAQSTLISYICYTIVVTYYAFKQFSFPIDYRKALLYLGGSIFMFLTVKSVGFGNHWANLLSKVGIGIMTYVIFVLIFEKTIRNYLLGAVKSLRRTSCRGLK